MRRLLSVMIALLPAVFRTAAAEDELPIQGTPVFAASRLSDFRLLGQGPQAEYSSAAVDGQPFDWAIAFAFDSKREAMRKTLTLPAPASIFIRHRSTVTSNRGR